MIIVKFKKRDITKQLEKYEDKKNIKLPEDYRNFLLKYNGGETDQTSFDINGYSNGIRAFYGFIDKNRQYSINNSMHEWTLSSDYVEKDVVLIACLEGGDELAIGIGDRNYGQIFALDHEKGYQGIKVSDNFKEFISQVISIPVDKESLEHPDDIIKRMINEHNGVEPGPVMEKIYWEQYNEMLNANYEEVVLD